MNQFTHKLQHVLERCLYAKCAEQDALFIRERMLVSLSGGADSTALLLAMTHLAKTNNWDIFACHVNHNLRGEESKGDEEFCRSLCSNLNIELDVYQDNKSGDARSNAATGSSALGASEESLRKHRYRFLIQSAQKLKARYILTAHTLDDQIETVLFRLMRGSSLRGLSGIKLVSELKKNICLIRPLLSFTKEQCCQFLAENRTGFRIDSSNTNQKFARNYLRHTLIPLINARFDNFSSHIEQLREIIEKEDVWLRQLTKQQISQMEKITGLSNAWPIDSFKSCPLALRRRMVAEALRQRNIEPSFKRIDEIISACDINTRHISENGKSTICLNGDWRIQFTGAALLWLNNRQREFSQMTNINGQTVRGEVNVRFDPIIVRIPGNNIVLSCSRVLTIENLSSRLEAGELFNFPEADSAEALVDLAGAIFPLVLRLHAKGDMIQPLGMKEKVRLKKYLHTHKRLSTADSQPFARQLLAARGSSTNAQSKPVIVLVDQEEVIWVPGVGLSEKVKVVKIPSHMLKWLPLASNLPDIA